MRLAMALTAVTLVAEVIGGLMSNSLALLSDAGHVFTDFLALGLSWFGLAQEQRAPTLRMTFGYHRIGLLIAVVNALTLGGVAVYIFYHAYLRLQAPQPVQGPLMLAVALVGLTVNVTVLFLLRPYQRRSLNIRSAFFNVAGDALGSLGVVVGGVVVSLSGFYLIDPMMSIFIGVLITVGAGSIIRESMPVLLEAAPRGLNPQDISQAIREVPEVKRVNDLHVWSVAPGINALSAHVLIDDRPVSAVVQIRENIHRLLERRFHIEHATIQFECSACRFCILPVSDNSDEEENAQAGGMKQG